MKLIFAEDAWEDCLYWQKQDGRMVDRINKLISETQKPIRGQTPYCCCFDKMDLLRISDGINPARSITANVKTNKGSDPLLL